MENTALCVPCGKEFASQAQLQAHQRCHVTCTFPECEFSASAKAVQSHLAAVHFSLHRSPEQSAEEVEEYRNKRKLNFPTREKLQQKEEELERRRQRGELLPELQPFVEDSDDEDEGCGPKEEQQRDGGSELVERAVDIVFADAVTEAPEKEEVETELVLLSGGVQGECKGTQTTPLCRFFSRKGGCRDGEACRFLHINSDSSGRNSPDRKRQIVGTSPGRMTTTHAQKTQRKKKPSLLMRRSALLAPPLLNRLLRKEAHKANSAALQCIRYLIRRNFLQGVEEDPPTQK